MVKVSSAVLRLLYLTVPPSVLVMTAGFYAGTLALCIAAYVYDNKKKMRRQALADFGRGEATSLTASKPGSSYGTSPRPPPTTL